MYFYRNQSVKYMSKRGALSVHPSVHPSVIPSFVFPQISWEHSKASWDHLVISLQSNSLLESTGWATMLLTGAGLKTHQQHMRMLRIYYFIIFLVCHACNLTYMKEIGQKEINKSRGAVWDLLNGTNIYKLEIHWMFYF